MNYRLRLLYHFLIFNLVLFKIHDPSISYMYSSIEVLNIEQMMWYCKTGYFSGHVVFAVDIQSAKINDCGFKK